MQYFFFKNKKKLFKIELLMEISKLKKLIEKTLNINKAEKIVSISLKGKSYIADYMIIASGTSSRHIQSLSEILLSTLEKKVLVNLKLKVAQVMDGS